MRGLFTKQWHSIDAGQAVSGITGRAQTLRIQHGRVWITAEGLAQDYWLSAGDSFIAPPGRLVVVEADQGGSQLAVTTGCRPSLPAQLRTLARRLSFGKRPQAGLQQCMLAPCPRQA